MPMPILLTVVIILVALLVAYIIIARAGYEWVFNGYMIIGAVLGLLISSAVSDCVRAVNHKGPGYVTYGDEDHDDVTEKVSESEYKEHHFWQDGVVLFVAISVWVMVAKDARERKSKGANRSERDDELI